MLLLQVLLFSARMNMKNTDRKPYDTAFFPGEQPVGQAEKKELASALKQNEDNLSALSLSGLSEGSSNDAMSTFSDPTYIPSDHSSEEEDF